MRGAGGALRFVLNITVCWLLAYGLAQPIMARLLAETALSEQLKGNLTLLAGSGLFVILNYGFHRRVAFKSK